MGASGADSAVAVQDGILTTDDRSTLLRDLWRYRATLRPGEPQKRINRCISALMRCWERLDAGNAPAATFAHIEALEAAPFLPLDLMDRVQQAAKVTA